MRIFLLLTFCVVHHLASAQGNFEKEKDSIQTLLVAAKEDTNKVILLMKTGWWWETYSLDSAARYYQKMNVLSTKINYVDGILRYYANYTYILNHQGKHEEGLKLNLESIALARKKGSKTQVANCLFNTGSSYNNMARYEEAIDYYIQAAKIFEQLQLQRNLAFAYGNIGALFYNIDQPEKGLQYSLLGLEKARLVKDVDQEATFLINCGIGASKTNKLNEAEKYFKEGLEVVKQSKIMTIPIQGYILLGELYITMNRLPESLEYAKKGLDESRKIDSRYNVMQALKVLAEAYAKMGNHAEAERYSKEAIQYGKDNNFSNDFHKLYFVLAEAQAGKGDYKSAYNDMRISRHLEDSVNQKEITKKIEQLEISYQSSEKGRQILLLQQAQKNQQLLIGGLATGILVILIIGMLAYFNLQNRRKISDQKHQLAESELQKLRHEQQLLAAESILRGHEEERRRIAADLHDGLGGLLSGVKISLSNMKQNMVMTSDNLLVFERSIDMLNNSIQELRRVAHNMMPESLVKFGLSTAVGDFCESIASMKAMAIDFQTVGEERRLDSSTEIILYRILQELINNALKHSGAQNVIVQLGYQPNLISLTVEDDGRGFDPEALNKTTGSGWPNIRSRVDYLKGTLDVKTGQGEGTSVYINVTA